jgi:hypothetical protein
MLLVTTALSGLLASTVPASAAPQTAPQDPPPVTRPAPATSAPVEEDEDAYDLGTVVVTGSRPRGAVDTDIEPELSLTADQIQAYGAANISELLAYLEPVTRSSQGRDGGQPVLLVNGRRISGFREIQSIPTEAIERTDILPEEVALQFGYRADQRVVNFVLKAQFRSISAEASYRAPTQGGRTTTELESTLFNIAGGNRYSVDAEYTRSTPLFESERDIRRDPDDLPADLFGDPADQGAYRTLLSQSEQLEARGSVKRDLNSTTQGTLSVSLENTNTRSFNGLPGVVIDVDGTDVGTGDGVGETVFRYLDAPASLGRKTDTLTANVGTVLDGFIGEDWRWTFSGNYDRVETNTFTGRGYGVTPFQDRVNAGDPTADPFGTVTVADFAALAGDTANSVSQSLGAELVLTGDLYDLPAGGISSTFKVGADTRSLDSTSVRSGDVFERSQSRDRFTGSGSFTFPIADRGQGVLPFLGDLSVNFNAGYEELSDFGGLPVVGVGLNWSPIEPLSFLVSYTDEQGAPSISQLNDPIVSTFNVPVFDIRTGQTVFVTRTDGGNPNLNADNRRVFKAGVTFRPLGETDLSLSSTWTVSQTDDVIAAFPTITPELEAALPERFERAEPVDDQTIGTLLSFDARALNYDSAERQDIRTGFNFSRAFGTPTPAAAGAPGMPGARGARGPGGGGGPRAGGPPGGGAVRFGGGGGRGRGGGMQPGQGRFNLSVYHTWRLQDEIVIRDGLPVIDLLDGGATGSRGGSPRHEIQAQGGVFRNGMGAFVNANWRDSTQVGDTLRFSDQTTINLNMFVDLGQQQSLVQRFGWLEGSRLNLGFQNIFDTRTEVTTLDGSDLPLNYQSDYLDPQGRTISLTFRKILF